MCHYNYPPYSIEGLWAVENEDSNFKLKSIPFYAKGIALDDVFSVTQKANNELFFNKVIASSGNSTLRIFMFQSNENDISSLINDLINYGCDAEQVHSHMYSINVPKEINLKGLLQFLDDGVNAGSIFYEIGKRSSNHT